jgi:uncharacterized membrane protein YfcA
MSLDQILVFVVLLGAYFVRGLTGFGSGLIAVPLLAFIQPLQSVVPLVLALDFIASFILGGVNTKQTAWKEIRYLLPFGAIGAVFGVFALMRFPPDVLVFSLGCFTAYFGARNLLGVEPKGGISALWAVPAGLVGSATGAVFGTSGPPYIIYLTHRLQDKTTVRATFSWLFVIDGGFRLALFFAAGLLLRVETQLAILIGLIPMTAGLYLGNRVHINISRESLLKIVGGILVASGLTLVLKVII